MSMSKRPDDENPWIADHATYVYKDEANNLRQEPLTYGLVYRRMNDRNWVPDRGGIPSYRRILDRIERDMMYTYVESGGKHMNVFGSAWGALARTVDEMDWFARLIVDREGKAFDFVRREDGKLIGVEERELGRYYPFMSGLVHAIFRSEANLVRLRLPPFAELLRDVMRYCTDEIPILLGCFDRLPTFCDRNVDRFCGELFDKLCRTVFEEAKARDVKKLVSAQTAETKRAICRMQKVKRECFAGREKLFVMPLECGYLPEIATEPLDKLKKDHAKFVNRLRGNSRFAAVAILGIWSLTWGEQKGHCVRWLFLLDASLIQDSTEWTELVASIWTKAVTDGAAYVRIPGVNDAPSSIAGPMRVDDAAKMKLLDEETEYSAVKDTIIQPKELEGIRAWGTWVPANTRKNRRKKIAG